MEKRKITLGDYDTAVHLWTLVKLDLTDPEQVTNYVSVPGRRSGPLDLSTVLTDGDPVYGSRTLTARLETSEGDRVERESRIRELVNALDGSVQRITLPDDPLRFLVGRVHVSRVYNDMAHAAVQLTAICEPWRYATADTVLTFPASGATRSVWLPNAGRLSAIPEIRVTGGNVTLTVDGTSRTLTPGVYSFPDLMLRPLGGYGFSYSGSGAITATYREAIL